MQLLLLSRYTRIGASSRLRSFQYVEYLKEKQVEITVSPLFDDEYLTLFYTKNQKRLSHILYLYYRRFKVLFSARRYDLVWIEKELLPWLPPFAEMYLHNQGIPYLVDYDDAIFHRYDLSPRSFVRKFLGNKIDKIMKNAAVVVAGNNYLAARARKAGAMHVEILPTVVDMKRYTVKEKRMENNECFTVGWVGSPSTTKYLFELYEPLKLISEKDSTCLMTVGAPPLEIDGVNVNTLPWQEDTEVETIQSFDVGVMPLPDNPWEKGKCGYKLIQYMACGLPVVASPVGANVEIVDHGTNGFLANTPAEWIEALQMLRKDRQLREKMGNNGREKVKSSYSLQVHSSRLYKFLQDAATKSV